MPLTLAKLIEMRDIHALKLHIDKHNIGIALEPTPQVFMAQTKNLKELPHSPQKPAIVHKHDNSQTSLDKEDGRCNVNLFASRFLR